MCGRFVLFTSELLEHVGKLPELKKSAPDGVPDLDTILPRHDGARHPRPRISSRGSGRWGFATLEKGPEGPPLLMPAASCRVKPSFRMPTKAQMDLECVIPMNGYYEWHEKVPHCHPQ